MNQDSLEKLRNENEILRSRLEECEELIGSIRNGSVDALAIQKDGKSNVFTLESTDFAYRVLVENFGESALNISENGLIIYANPAFGNLLQINTGEIIGNYFQSFVCEKSAAKFESMLKAALKGNSKDEIVLCHKEKKFSVYISLNTLQPRIPAIGITITDLTEKIESERKLKFSEDQLQVKVNELSDQNVELEQFIHIISHDLQEPLRKITLCGDKLNRITAQQPLTEEAQHCVNVMKDSAFRMKDQIRDLLIYTTSIDRRSISYDNVDLNEVLNKATKNIESSILERKGEIITELLPMVRGNESQLTLLFQNLFSNSIKYSKADTTPEIKIKSEIIKGNAIEMPEGYYHKIVILDNGIGFEQKYSGKIFGIFQRLHGKTEYSGTGLGLAICKRIVENHKGIIRADGAIGEGATFSVFLPV